MNTEKENDFLERKPEQFQSVHVIRTEVPVTAINGDDVPDNEDRRCRKNRNEYGGPFRKIGYPSFIREKNRKKNRERNHYCVCFQRDSSVSLNISSATTSDDMIVMGTPTPGWVNCPV